MHLLVVLLECLRAMLARRRTVPQPGTVPAESGAPRGGASPSGEPNAFQSWADDLGPRRMTRWPDVGSPGARNRFASGVEPVFPAVTLGERFALVLAAWRRVTAPGRAVRPAPRQAVAATGRKGNPGPFRAGRSSTANG